MILISSNSKFELVTSIVSDPEFKDFISANFPLEEIILIPTLQTRFLE